MHLSPRRSIPIIFLLPSKQLLAVHVVGLPTVILVAVRSNAVRRIKDFHSTKLFFQEYQHDPTKETRKQDYERMLEVEKETTSSQIARRKAKNRDRG